MVLNGENKEQKCKQNKGLEFTVNANVAQPVLWPRPLVLIRLKERFESLKNGNEWMALSFEGKHNTWKKITFSLKKTELQH